jgi:hypothetical protein
VVRGGGPVDVRRTGRSGIRVRLHHAVCAPLGRTRGLRDTKAIAENDEEAQFDLEGRYLDHETESHHELSFVSRFQDIEARFDPEARARMENSEGVSEAQADPISTTSNDD